MLSARARATPDIETSALPERKFELVVVEALGCIYCRLFRRDVLPSYAASPRAREVPLRFVDLVAANGGKLALTGPIGVLPTVLLLRDGREVGRIPGYVGPENFFHSVNDLLSRTR